RIFKNYTVLYFIFSTLILLSIFWFFIIGKNLFLYEGYGGDSLHICWPLKSFVVNTIKDGSGFWGWELGIGTNILAVQADLMDPFNLFLLLFPQDSIVYGFVFMSIAKLSLSGYFFFCCLRLRGCRDKSALLLSLLFCVNTFALLWMCQFSYGTSYLYGIGILFGYEYYRVQKKPWLLMTFVFLLAIQSVYFLWIILVAVLIVALFDAIFMCKLKEGLLYIGKLFLWVLFGIALAAFLFLPQCWLLISNPRASGTVLPSFNLGNSYLYTSLYAKAWNGWGLGGYAVYGGFFSEPVYSASAICLLSLTQLFTKKLRTKKIVAVTIMIAFSLIFISFVSPIFNVFSQTTFRWTWLLLIPIFYGAAKVFSSWEETKQINVKTGAVTTIIMFACWILCLSYLIKYIKTPDSQAMGVADIMQIPEAVFANLMTAITFGIAGIALLVYRFSKKAFSVILVSVMIVIECVILPAQIINTRVPLSSQAVFEGTYYDGTMEAVEQIKGYENEQPYRIDKNYTSVHFDDALIQNYEGIKVYLPNNSPSYLEFSEVMGAEPSGIFIKGFDGRNTVQSLLGVRYVLSKTPNEIEGYELFGQNRDTYIFKNKYPLPFGYMYYSYTTEAEFLKASIDQKEQLLSQNAVIKEAPLLQITEKVLDNKESTTEALKKLSQSPLEVVSKNNSGLKGNICVKEDGILFISIGYDKGWSAKVDGVNKPVQCVNIGFCGIELSAGEHTIELKYEPPLMKAGIVVSCISIGILAGMFFFYRRRKKY
ncbi:MAG: YfhO family protein, partial [Lachnospiraceae bacterium]